MNTTN